MDGNSKDYRLIISALCQAMRPKIYLEVGCRNGSTLKYLIETCKKTNTLFHAIDVRDVKKNLPKQVYFHLGDSQEVAKHWSLPIDMLFIDADHSAESVLNDFLAYSKHVSPNGIILLHDTFPANASMALPNNCGDAWKTAWKIRQEMTRDFEIVTLPIVNGLSIIRKSQTQITWQESVK